MNEQTIKDEPILSINEVISCCYDDTGNNGILYLHIDKLTDLANEKLRKKPLINKIKKSK